MVLKTTFGQSQRWSPIRGTLGVLNEENTNLNLTNMVFNSGISLYHKLWNVFDKCQITKSLKYFSHKAHQFTMPCSKHSIETQYICITCYHSPGVWNFSFYALVLGLVGLKNLLVRQLNALVHGKKINIMKL